ncbi:MAG: hypothetical protein JWN76_434 [Chitinophagaceae bacterium]|nr:hypothetical protein [Chitinophagaceae bacterium]
MLFLNSLLKLNVIGYDEAGDFFCEPGFSISIEHGCVTHLKVMFFVEHGEYYNKTLIKFKSDKKSLLIC